MSKTPTILQKFKSLNSFFKGNDLLKVRNFFFFLILNLASLSFGFEFDMNTFVSITNKDTTIHFYIRIGDWLFFSFVGE